MAPAPGSLGVGRAQSTFHPHETAPLRSELYPCALDSTSILIRRAAPTSALQLNTRGVACALSWHPHPEPVFSARLWNWRGPWFRGQITRQCKPFSQMTQTKLNACVMQLVSWENPTAVSPIEPSSNRREVPLATRLIINRLM